MENTIVGEYQLIADYLLKKHFGLTLNDTDLHDNAVVQQLVESNIPVYEVINQLVEKYQLDRIDQNYWSSACPLLAMKDYLVAVVATIPDSFHIVYFDE